MTETVVPGLTDGAGAGTLDQVDGLDGAGSLDGVAGTVDDVIGDLTLQTDGVIGGGGGSDPDPPGSPDPDPTASGDPPGGSDEATSGAGGSGATATSTGGAAGAGGGRRHDMTPTGSRDAGTSGLTYGALQLARPLAPAVAVAVIGLLLLAAAARGNDRLVKRDADGSRAGSWRL